MKRNPFIWQAVLVHAALFLFIYLLPVHPKEFGDHVFHREAQQFSAFLKGNTPVAPIPTQAPAPSAFYTVAYLFVPESAGDSGFWLAGFVFNALLVVGGVAYFLAAAERRFGLTAAKACLWLLVLFPLHVYYAYSVAAEPLAAASVLFLIGALLDFRPEKKWRQQKASFALLFWLTVLCLSRPNAAMVYPVFAGMLLLVFLLKRRRIFEWNKGILAPVAISFAASVLVLQGIKMLGGVPETERGQNEHLWYVIHEGHFQFRSEPFDWRFWDASHRPDSKDHHDWTQSRDSLNQEAFFSKVPIAQVHKEFVIKDKLANPWTSLRQFFVKIVFGQVFQAHQFQPKNFALVTASGQLEFALLHVAVNIVNIAIWVFAVYALAAGVVPFDRMLLPICLVLSLWLFHGLTYMEPRYMLPTRFVFILLAGLGVAHFINRKKKTIEADATP